MKAIATKFWILCAFMVLAHPVSAQIVIDRPYFEARADTSILFETYVATNPGAAQAIVDASLENGTFDFSALAFQRQYQEVTISRRLPAGTPGEDLPEFANADYVNLISYGDFASPDSTSYVYHRITDDGLLYLGWVTRTDQTSPTYASKTLLQPAFMLWRTPLTYQTSWTVQSQLTITEGDSPVWTQSYEQSNNIEGYGTLVLPIGSYDVLRMRRQTTISASGQPQTSRLLYFKTGENATATISLSAAGAPLFVSYSVSSHFVTSNDVVAGIPEGFSLDQNYPNPFNPSTTIGFEIPVSQHVSLRVFDSLGREVDVLVDGMLPSGRHEARFQADGLPSGIYLYRMESGTFHQTGRMTLIK
jgi:hypothetical protein